MDQQVRRPTLQQVALHAGVSRSTAGAALAGSPRVARVTVERVRNAALSLGYRTQPHARQLRQGGPELVSIVLDTRLTHTADGALHPFWSRVLTGFLARMQTSGWLCAVQLQLPDVPLLPAPAPGVILATGDHGQVSMFVHDTFGQRVFSPVGHDEADAQHLSLWLATAAGERLRRDVCWAVLADYLRGAARRGHRVSRCCGVWGPEAQQRNTRIQTGSTSQHSRRLKHRMSRCCGPRSPSVVLLRIPGGLRLNNATLESRPAQQRHTRAGSRTECRDVAGPGHRLLCRC